MASAKKSTTVLPEKYEFQTNYSAMCKAIEKEEEGFPTIRQIKSAKTPYELTRMFMNAPSVLKMYGGDFQKPFGSERPLDEFEAKLHKRKWISVAHDFKGMHDKSLAARNLKRAVQEISEGIRYCPFRNSDDPEYEAKKRGTSEPLHPPEKGKENGSVVKKGEVKHTHMEKDDDEGPDTMMNPDTVMCTHLLYHRAKTLSDLSRFYDVLRDLDRSHLYKYLTESSRQESIFMRAHALRHLGRYEELMDAIEECKEEIKTMPEMKQLAYLKRVEDLCPSSTDHHEGLTCEDRAADLPSLFPRGLTEFAECAGSHASPAGRFIRAANDVRVGDVILTELPFAAVLAPSAFYTHCYCCFARIRYSIEPCRECARVSYCSERCEIKAWPIHKHECRCVVEANSISFPMAHLALRTALTAGITACRAAANGKTISGPYADIASLVSHFSKRDAPDRVWRTAMALHLTRCGACDGYASQKRGDVEAFAGTILHLLQVLPCNAHEISALDKRGPPQEGPSAWNSIEIGSGIYPTLSLFNHSCDPDVTRNFYGTAVSVRATVNVNKGSPINDNYGNLWATERRDVRRSELGEQYYFKCECEACRGDWPLYSAMKVSTPPQLRCTKCAQPMVDSTKCGKCSHTIDREKCMDMILRSYANFAIPLSDYVDGRLTGSEALPKFLAFAGLVNRLCVRPHKSINEVQESIKSVYSGWGNVVLDWDV